jgi:peptidoglycan/LPS O-acetylase OafA/YrhL
MLIGALACVWHRKRWAAWGQLTLLAALSVPAVAAMPLLLQAPFNPLTLALPMLGLIVAVLLTTRHLPDAGRCLRTRPVTSQKGVDAA